MPRQRAPGGEQRRHHEEEPGARALRRRERHLARGAEAQRHLLAPVPAEDVPAPEGGEQQSDTAQQGDQRQHRPDDHVGRRLVVHARLGRPVVRVGVVVPGPLRRAGPGRPAEERRQRRQILTIGDRVRRSPCLVVGSEKKSVVPDKSPVCRGLRCRELELAARPVVAVGPEVRDRPARRGVRALAAVARRTWSEARRR